MEGLMCLTELAVGTVYAGTGWHRLKMAKAKCISATVVLAGTRRCCNL